MLKQLWLRFWKREKAGLLNESLRRQLQDRYSLDSEILKRLSYVSRPGIFDDNKTTYIRIYDPSLLDGGVQTVSRYTGLDNQMPALLFEGRLTRRVFDSVSDFRPNTGKGVTA